MKGKPSYKELLRKRERLLKKLGSWPPVLRGSMRKHGNICGNPTCRCKDPNKPILHGPYNYLSHRTGKKTQTIFLNKAKLQYTEKWINNYKRLIQAIYELSDVNFKLLRYYYMQIDKDKKEIRG